MFAAMFAACGGSSPAPRAPDTDVYIVGTVVDAAGAPAADAQVTVTLRRTVSIGTTDERGRFVLRGIESANETSADVTATLGGRQGSYKLASLHAGKNEVPAIRLAP